MMNERLKKLETGVMVACGPAKYRIKNGCEAGGMDWGSGFLEEATEEKVKELKLAEAKKELIDMIENIEWSQMSLEDLQSVGKSIKKEYMG